MVLVVRKCNVNYHLELGRYLGLFLADLKRANSQLTQVSSEILLLPSVKSSTSEFLFITAVFLGSSF